MAINYFSVKKDVCEATQAKGLTPHMEKKKTVQAVEFFRHHVQRNQGRSNSQEGKEGSRPEFPAYHGSWSLRNRQKGWKAAQSV